ncbi:MAG: UDP-3-O-(3-hydroxymyristoyl)glucosamine N-acyltransferase [Neisseriaceae bacterium]|nr:MAG: UDP-3-O-(3-hydroxymyristoyl)glucosamine N-acyltransferase [Neisseriaceae bacterium]
MAVELSELITLFGGMLVGSDLIVEGISSLDLATEKQLSFLTDHRLKNEVYQSKACALIVGSNFDYTEYFDKSFIVCDNAYLYFARVLQYFHPAEVSNCTTHFSAVIESDQIDATVEIGANVFIGKGVKVGAYTRISSGSVIGKDVTIGEHCYIHPNVTIYNGSTIGDNVEIHSGSVIGADGFGFAWNGASWEKIPQVGNVEIHDDVEIGSNVSIDRGAIGNTVIHKGVKIDNLVQIAHNCEIGEHTAIAAMVGLAGSTRIGKRCRIAGAAKFTGHLTVADDTLIAGATIVSHSIDHPGKQYAGSYPFHEYQDWKYNAVYLRRLRDMNQRLTNIEKKLIKDPE